LRGRTDRLASVRVGVYVDGFNLYYGALCDVSGHRKPVNPQGVGSRVSCFAGGLVCPGGVEDEFAEDLPGGGVDDGDVEVLD
jgi:hypothetical protein